MPAMKLIRVLSLLTVVCTTMLWGRPASPQ